MEQPVTRPLSQHFVEELLRGLSDPLQAPQVLSMLKETNLLQWIASTPYFTLLLHACASRGHVSVLERAASAAPGRLDDQDATGRTALHCAADATQLLALSRLLDLSANPRITDIRGNTVLHALAKHRIKKRNSIRETSQPGFAASMMAYALHSWQKAKNSSSSSSSTTAAAPAPSMGLPTSPLVGGDQILLGSSPLSGGLYGQMDSPPSMVGGGSDAVSSTPSVPILQDGGNSLTFSPPPPPSSFLSSPPPNPEALVAADEGVTSEAALDGPVAELASHIVKRLAKSIDVNARNSKGKTPLQVALEHNNTPIARCLRELGGIVIPIAQPEEPAEASPSSSSSTGAAQQQQKMRLISAASANIAKHASQIRQSVADSSTSVMLAMRRKLKMAAKNEFLGRVREILDESPRKVVPRIQVTPGSKYRILAMDGGGVRCIMHCLVLHRLLQRFPSLLDDVQLYCGCSGSAPIATSLLVGLSIGQVAKLVELASEKTLRKAQSNGITSVRYTNKWLKLEMQVILGSARMCDLPRHCVIPSFKLDNGNAQQPSQRKGEAHVFHNLFEQTLGETLAADVCLRSGAAPAYFPPYQGYVDGGVFSTNPVGSALPLVVGREGIHHDPENIVCLSLGTGISPAGYIQEDSIGAGGLYGWGTRLVDVFVNAQNSHNDNAAMAILGDRYFRLQPYLPLEYPLDDVKSIPALKAIAESVPLDATIAWIEKNWF